MATGRPEFDRAWELLETAVRDVRADAGTDDDAIVAVMLRFSCFLTSQQGRDLGFLREMLELAWTRQMADVAREARKVGYA